MAIMIKKWGREKLTDCYYYDKKRKRRELFSCTP